MAASLRRIAASSRRGSATARRIAAGAGSLPSRSRRCSARARRLPASCRWSAAVVEALRQRLELALQEPLASLPLDLLGRSSTAKLRRGSVAPTTVVRGSRAALTQRMLPVFAHIAGKHRPLVVEIAVIELDIEYRSPSAKSYCPAAILGIESAALIGANSLRLWRKPI